MLCPSSLVTSTLRGSKSSIGGAKSYEAEIFRAPAPLMITIKSSLGRLLIVIDFSAMLVAFAVISTILPRLEVT